MIDIYTESIGEEFLSVWGKVMTESLCKVHTYAKPLECNCIIDAMGDCVIMDKDGKIIQASSELEEDVQHNMPDIYDYTESGYLERVRTDKSFVAERPNAIFILNISEEEANDLTKTYGILCQSINSMSLTLLEQNMKRPLNRTRGFRNWGDCLQTKNNKRIGDIIPSNSIIILDRYLFSGGNKNHFVGDIGPVNEEIDFGIENVKDILKCLLPSSFCGDYNVLVIFDPKSMISYDKNKAEWDAYKDKKKELCQLIAEKLKNMVAQEFHDVSINFEVLCIECADFNKDIYDETHDRRIISNYYIMFASRGFKAFKNGEVVNSQNVTFDTWFSKGSESDLISDFPLDSHQYIVDELQSHINYLKKNKDIYNAFYQNGLYSKLWKMRNSILIRVLTSHRTIEH